MSIPENQNNNKKQLSRGIILLVLISSLTASLIYYLNSNIGQ